MNQEALKTKVSPELFCDLLALMEKQYRKGFQHGHLSGTEGNLTEEEVSDWRDHPGGYYQSIDPHTGRRYDQCERMECESFTDLLDAFFTTNIRP